MVVFAWISARLIFNSASVSAQTDQALHFLAFQITYYDPLTVYAKYKYSDTQAD